VLLFYTNPAHFPKILANALAQPLQTAYQFSFAAEAHAVFWLQRIDGCAVVSNTLGLSLTRLA
jgi:hypothetical protein